MTAVRIVLASDATVAGPDGDGRISAVWNAMLRERLDVLSDDPLVWALDVRSAWGLWRDSDLIGLMLISTDGESLDATKEAVLGVLAGQVAIAIENCRLVEEKVRLERELMKKERLAALGQMAATVAHEVKNPLSAIKSIVQVMREEEKEGPRSQDLRLIVGEVDRLSGTVTQLLSFSRPAVGESQSVTVDELTRSVVRLLEADASASGVDLRARIDGDREVPGTVGAAMREVLVNLGLNAIQATPRGGCVEIDVVCAPNAVRIDVTDTGSGVPEALRVKIREPFFTTRQRGTGLGLAIVERRVAELRGSLEIESPLGPDGGTRARAELLVD